jgi:hypothetical protein
VEGGFNFPTDPIVNFPSEDSFRELNLELDDKSYTTIWTSTWTYTITPPRPTPGTWKMLKSFPVIRVVPVAKEKYKLARGIFSLHLQWRPAFGNSAEEEMGTAAEARSKIKGMADRNQKFFLWLGDTIRAVNISPPEYPWNLSITDVEPYYIQIGNALFKKMDRVDKENKGKEDRCGRT